MTNKKRILAFSKANDLRLNVQLKQIQKYRIFLDSIRKINKSKSTKNINLDFINALKKDFESAQNLENKSVKIENHLYENKKTIKKIDNNIDKYESSNDKKEKENLFEELERDILKLEKMIEVLRAENQNLRKELELLIEKEQKIVEKNNFEKQNNDLKNKIEALKNKTTESKNDFVNSTQKSQDKDKSMNKITYRQKSNENEKEK